VKRLIVTGDDFGIAEPVNEAIERAYRQGILTAASLMVGGAAAADAVTRARRNPGLRVGLHLALVEARPVLPASEVPDLVDANGELRSDLVAAGFRFFFSSRVRRQLAGEIRAQLEAFRATGLPLDHVNAHNHMHVHPTVLRLLLEIGPEFGLASVRVPFEPPGPSWRARRSHALRRLLQGAGFGLLAAGMRARLGSRVAANDYIFGLNDTGAMNEATLLALVERIPDGVTEIYLHPATRRCPEIDRTMADYDHQGELAALLSERVRARIEALGIERTSFSEIRRRATPGDPGPAVRSE
jgi:hopanoid biosynthesis associated protein HpnK